MQCNPGYTEYNHHLSNRSKQHINLCHEQIMDEYCSSNRPRGSWCNKGYHWTLNDEMHFGNHGELPMVYSGNDDICQSILQCMECMNQTQCNKRHPNEEAHNMRNRNNTFSQIKPCWGSVDYDDYINLGLLPMGVQYDWNHIVIRNFRQFLNEYVLDKYKYLVANTFFVDQDFDDDRVIDAL